jgi:uncharacterized coiled-coil DUF342 family protein
MSFTNGEQRLELRDPKGATLGYFLSERELQEVQAEREKLRKQLADLQAQIDTMGCEKNELLNEVDNYRKIMEVWERDGIAPMTRREMADLEQNGIPGERVLAEIEKIVRASAAGA